MKGPQRDMKRFVYLPFLIRSIHCCSSHRFTAWFINLLQAAKFVEHDSSFNDEEKQQSKALKVSCNLNNAACKLKLKDYKQAEKLCTKVRQRVSPNIVTPTFWGNE